MVKDNSTWDMFFEVMNSQTHQGDIGLAISNDGSSWVYKQIVLDELFHLSYPYVFRWKNEYYMIPDSHQANAVRLYKAVDDPTYGSQVLAFEITELTTSNYEEKKVLQNPILKTSRISWKASGMHHIDPHQIDENKWIACVDGCERSITFGLHY